MIDLLTEYFLKKRTRNLKNRYGFSICKENYCELYFFVIGVQRSSQVIILKLIQINLIAYNFM